MIEHFSKWQKLMPLPNHSDEAYAFFNMSFNRFEVLVEVLTNQSTKFHGEFQELHEKTLINHCTIL
jgi:hypothetical protein